MEQKQDINEILAKLDNKSRKARIISLAITASTMVIGLGLLAGLLFAANNLVAKRQELAQLNTEVNAKREEANVANQQAEQARAQYELLVNKTVQVKEALDKQCKLQNCDAPTDVGIKEAIKVLDDPTSKIDVTPTNPKDPRISDPPVNSKKTVYIQIVNCEQREHAKTVAKLIKGDYYFPGVQCLENLKGRISETQVKYFTESDLPFAKELVTQLRGQKIDAKFVLAKGSTNSPLEIWFSDGF